MHTAQKGATKESPGSSIWVVVKMMVSFGVP